METTMSRAVYRYSFDDRVAMADVRDTLFLAVFSAEGQYGRTRVRLDAAFRLEEDRRTCAIDGATPVGQTIASVFTELLARELGEEAFTVERLLEPPEPEAEPEPPSREGAAR